ncbi:hypothetical protein [Nonomuraea sp. NPDC050691]|uniref:hypothetical protein n=1 Tax=Nonomuraea sp. NPDC050691 TaxID=3155661 RepID=UPI0033D11BDB
MLVFSLGLAWLVLGPFSLWVLVSGRVWARAGAVMTLTMLEVATIATNAARVPVPSPHDVAGAASRGTRTECVAREPVPQAGRVDGRRGGLVLYWPATTGECATADVVLRADGNRLTVWLHEGSAPGSPAVSAPGAGHGAGESVPDEDRGAGERAAGGSPEHAPGGSVQGGAVTTVPVRVEKGRASLRVPLAGAAGGHGRPSGDARQARAGRYVLIDGRTGHRIPRQSPPSADHRPAT